MTEEPNYKMHLEPLGYMSTRPIPDAEILSHHYANIYYKNPQGTYSESYSIQEDVHRNLRYQIRLESALSFLDSNAELRNLNALDIGCGEGYFLKLMQQKGFECVGLDYSSDGISRHNPEMLKFFLPGDPYSSLETFILNDRKFDIVVAANVLEHVVDVSKFLSKAKSVMHENSLIIISVPNDTSRFQGYLVDEGFVDRPYYFAPPEHLNYFNNETLVKTLSNFDFVVCDLLSDFPIEWFIANSTSNYVNSPSKGPSAHAARVLIENIINTTDNIDAVLSFWRSLARIGMGRVLTAVCKIS